MRELFIRRSPSRDANGALEHLMLLKSRAQGDRRPIGELNNHVHGGLHPSATVWDNVTFRL